MQLYLVRHGQSHVNLADWNNGNSDEGLTELGQRQAALMAAWLPTQVSHIDHIYCSTMLRARETVAPLLAVYDRPVHYDDRLREVGNNRLDGQPWPNDNLPREYADYWASERPFSPVTPIIDGGETFMHFRIRVGLFVEMLVERHPQEVVLAVSHGGVIETIFDHVFNIGPWRRCEVWNKNTGVTHFEYVAHPQRETWRLHFHNHTEHLRMQEETLK